MNVRPPAVFAAVLVAALGLTACGSSSTTSAATSAAAAASSSAPSAAASSAASPAASGAGAAAAVLAKYATAPTTIPITTPLSKKVPAGWKVAYLNNGIPTSQQFAANLTAAAQALGWTLVSETYDPANPATIGSAFSTAINAGVNAIVVQALDGPLYAKYVPAAAAKKIMVVDTVTSGPATPGVTYVNRSSLLAAPSDEIAVNVIAADAADRSVTAHIVTISTPVFASTLGPIVDGIKTALAGANCPGCTADVLQLNPQAAITGQGIPPTLSYLQTHPDVNYVIAPNGLFANGLIPALKQNNLDKIRVLGFGPGAAQIAELKAADPQTIGWVAQNQPLTAWLAVDAIARQSIGDSLDDFKTAYGAPWLLLPSSGPFLIEQPSSPVDYPDQFKKLWLAS